MTKAEQVRRIVDELTRQANEQGKVIEIGWLSFRLVVVPPEASEVQLREMRKAFFAGAQHLFASILSIMTEDREPTAEDERRMSLVHQELEAWKMEVQQEHPPGRA